MPTWNLADIYDPKDKDKLISELKKKVNRFKRFRKKLNKSLSVEEFLQILKEKEKILELSSRLEGYASLKLSENTADSKANAEAVMISQLSTELHNEMLFFSIWFKEISKEQAEKYIKASGKYHYILERIRAYKPHSLKEKEEQIINLKDLTGVESAERFYDIITNKFTYIFEGKELTLAEINQYKQSKDRKQRRQSYDLVFEKYKENQEILGEIYKSIVNDWKNEEILLRGFKTPISARNFSNDIPDKATEALLKVIRRNVKLFQEYFRIKARICKIKDFDRYDLYAPYKESEKEYPYTEAKEITLNAYKEFDEKMFLSAKKIFDAQHIHSKVQKNKMSGAFCYSILKDITPYVMLNHVGKLNDLFTMMHELGHGIHAILAKEQTNFTFHATLPLAETASIFGEMILAQKLLREEDKKEKISVLTRMLDSQYASITRQGYFVIFEKEAHKRIAEGATVEDLNKLYLENLKEQFGNMKIDEIFQHEWKYIPHIYHTPFYCYAYSFGNLLVLALYRMYEEQGKDFIPKYLKILSYGGSESPEKILKEIGIDINKEEFWEKGFDIIREEIEKLKKLTK